MTKAVRANLITAAAKHIFRRKELSGGEAYSLKTTNVRIDQGARRKDTPSAGYSAKDILIYKKKIYCMLTLVLPI